MPTNISMDIYKNDDSTFFVDVQLVDGKVTYNYGNEKVTHSGELFHNNLLSPLEIMNTIITSLVENEKKGT